MSTPDQAGATGDQPKANNPDVGLSILDLASLSVAQLRIMRIVLREVEVSYETLLDMLGKLPEAEQLSRTEVDETLRDLQAHEWLTESNKRFKANLKRKSSRTVSEFVAPRTRRQDSASSLRNIWDSIENDDKK